MDIKEFTQDYMIIITKDEAMALRAKYGDGASITVTSKHKKGGRKKYYVAEERRNLFFLDRYRARQERRSMKKVEERY